MSSTGSHPEHFRGKEALGHIAEVQAQGIIHSAEVHGMEVPGHISAAADSARDTAVVMALVGILYYFFRIDSQIFLTIFFIFGLSWTVWKTGRSAWIGWFRLERLHRILEQEKWEIEHHRQQERDELRELYAAKGLEGKLLEDVLDVLMADDNRLLTVMVQEELGLSLATYEHPLKQALGAFSGGILAMACCIFGYIISPFYGVVIGSGIILAIASAVSAYHARNRMIPAICWNLGIGAVCYSFMYFLLSTIL